MSSRAPGLSLRSTLTAVTTLVVSLALLVSGVLVLLTSVLHQTTSSAAASVESIRLAQKAEIELLLHGRVTDALVKRDIEARITGRLAGARQFVTTEQEARILTEAASQVADYIASVRDGRPLAELSARQEAAYVALEAFVNINVTQARDAQAAATAWDRRANYMGAGVGALLLVGAAGVLFWLTHRAFAPVFFLSAAMQKFGNGDRGARAPETGPAELREMSRRFNEMATALATQREAQVAFLGGVAHDLRNPLSVVEMAVAFLPPDRPLPPEPRLRQLIEKIARQITRLNRMLGDFLDMAKIEAGELELKPGVHDARELVREAVELFVGTLPEPRLVVALPSEVIDVYCDDLRIEQVLTNLLSNAIKYSPAGSAIEIALERSAEEVIFRVTDQGLGIPESERERVFEPFRRVGLSKESVPGVGLGLFVVRRIVDLHGGRVDVDSTPGKGSSFRVYLPRWRGLDPAN